MHISNFSKKYFLSVVFSIVLVLCMLLVGCSSSISFGGNSGSSGPIGSGVQGVRVYVEPESGDGFLTGAIRGAQKSVWLEMYLLSDRNIIRAIEETAHRGIDVRVMLEPHPFGGGTSPRRTMDELSASGVKTEDSSPSFALTHEKGMIIDGTTAYIMTSNFTRSALGGYSGSSGTRNREYDIVDTNSQDVQAVIAIFNADWNRSNVQVNDSNLVVSPINSRNDLTSLINNAHKSLLIEGEEMNDSGIEAALASAAKRGVQVQVILPAPRGSSSDSNRPGIDQIAASGVQVKEDHQLYMHAKIIVADGQLAFVGSENISSESLDHNRELGILVSDPTVLTKLQQTFQQDWGISESV